MSTIERNEYFQLVESYVNMTMQSIFVTGKAGTGKTTLLHHIRRHTHKNVIVTAPTGVAAINAGGVTLHSLFHLPLHPYIPTPEAKNDLLGHIKLNNERRDLLRSMELLIIDEISMVRCDTFDAIDTILRSVRRDQRPFGGTQLMIIGDLFQLSPVTKHSEWNMLRQFYRSPYFYSSLVHQETPFIMIELSKVYRQANEIFVDLLNAVRNNAVTPEQYQLLTDRVDPDFVAPAEQNFITLTTHNEQAKKINYQRLNNLTTKSQTYHADIEGQFFENAYPADQSLELKVGAQVMFIKNDTQNQQYFNGKIGVIDALNDDSVMVQTDDARIDVNFHKWENKKYGINAETGQIETDTVGAFHQLPLRLAWAITIHKSQGLTFDHLMIDAQSAFSSGQVYVALSRCRSLEGIVLLSNIPHSAIKTDHQISEYQKNNSQSEEQILAKLNDGKQAYHIEIIKKIFGIPAVEFTTSQLVRLLRESTGVLGDKPLEWSVNLSEELQKEADVARRFFNQVEQIAQHSDNTNKISALTDRVQAAAQYFHPILRKWTESLVKIDWTTEKKSIATKVDNLLQKIFQELQQLNYYMDLCSKNFDFETFLEKKSEVKFSLERISIYEQNISHVIKSEDVIHHDLYQELREWRKEIADEEGVPLYNVLPNATLIQIANRLPIEKAKLKKFRGIGKIKQHKYGDSVVKIVKDYITLHGIVKEEIEEEEIIKTPKVIKTPTKEITLELFQKLESIEKVANERKLTHGTIVGHLIDYVKQGVVPLDKVLSPLIQMEIQDAINEIGSFDKLTELKSKLSHEIDYNDIRLFLAANPRK